MALDFSELNTFAPNDNSGPFDPRIIAVFQPHVPSILTAL
jgi:hypothetical protein